jgi:hypothetical protein
VREPPGGAAFRAHSILRPAGRIMTEWHPTAARIAGSLR